MTFDHFPILGLAISGGVDSMALAYLCSAMRGMPYASIIDFTGFVVDHKLRDGSTEEAQKVRDSLAQLGTLSVGQTSLR